MSSFFIKIGKLTASQTLTLANSVIAGMTGNPSYPAPSPPLATLTAAAAALSTAITNRGRRNTSGGAVATATLKSTQATAYSYLLQEAQYCMQTTPNDRLLFLSAGFPTYFIHAAGFKAKRTQQAARNLRALVRRDVNFIEVYLKWQKPLGHANGTAIKTWKVYRGENPNLLSMTDIATVTKTQYTDRPNFGPNFVSGIPIFYRVVGFNADGKSVTSDITKIIYIAPTT